VHAGHYISGAGHIGLIGWLLLGGVFQSEPLPFEMTEVSVITGAEFEAMLAAQQAPEIPTEVAQPAAPDVTPDAPEIAATPDQVIEQPKPIQTETPPADPAPEVTEQVALPPEAEVIDTPPELDQPSGDVAVIIPELAPRSVPRPVERVAPKPVAQPAPEATPDPDTQEAVTPEPAAEAPPEEPQEATAPEEATTEIVTEATQAPKASPRPPGRRPAAPKPQVAAAKPEPESGSSEDDDAAAIAAAVAAAQTPAETPKPAAASGPPLTAGEKEDLRVAVSSCWNVGSLSTAALQTTVVVSVEMAQNGKPLVGSIRMEGSSGGTAASAKQAFEAARRAIIRCGAKGYDLPADKYGQWQSIEMTFNPEKMRVK